MENEGGVSDVVSESDEGAEEDEGVEEDSGQEDESDEDETVGKLQEGCMCNHDLLGVVKVLKLKGDEAWQEKKTLVSVKVKQKKAKRGRPLIGETARWVFTDALTPIRPIPVSDAELETGAADWPIQDNGNTGMGLTAEEVVLLRAGKEGAVLGPIPAAVATAEIERKRKVKRLKEASKRGRRPKMGARGTKEPKVDPAQRVAEFSGHSLRVSNGELFCAACVQGSLSLRKCTIKLHLGSKSHKQNLEMYNAKMLSAQQTIEMIAKARNEAPDDRGG